MAEIKDVTCLFMKKHNVFKAIKILVFTALLITVICLYGVDIFTKFQNDATTFTFKTEKAKNFFTPPILICMENVLKPTVMKKYGLETILDFYGSVAVKMESSVWDVFVKASYILNRDFSLFLYTSAMQNKTTWLSLSTGGNNFFPMGAKVYQVNVQEYHVDFAGTCYQIDSNYSISPPDGIGLTLEFDESLNQSDIPTVCI